VNHFMTARPKLLDRLDSRGNDNGRRIYLR
jgi:hypothetical protein